MSFYKNSNTNIKEFKRHTFFRIGQYIKLENHLLIVEDATSYKLYTGPCKYCFFNRFDMSCIGCCCSNYERRGFDNKDIIYREVKI